jgi:RimJ/RimL family protein N-acetyltransferase
MTAAAQHEIGETVLETERLRLRRFRPEDADAVFAVIGDEVAMQYYPRKFSWDDAMAWVERNMRRYREHGHGLYAVTLKGRDEIIGDTGIVRQLLAGEPMLEVGYHFRRDQWGHGYATEAARACMEYAFRELGAEKVISLIRPENLPSRRVAERNGMTVERELAHAGLPHLVYAKKREDHGKA